jgi:uncharacterized protein YcfJ
MYKFSHKSSRNFIAILFPLFITACASNPKHVSMLRSGDEVSIQSPETITGEYDFTFSNEAFTDSLSTGASTGAVVGGLAGALVCGPLFLICAGIGAAVYGTAGAVIGTVVGVTTDLSVYERAHLDAINSKIDTFITSKNPQKSFLTSVMTTTGERYQNTPSADKKITVLFSAMGLNHQGDDNVVLITQSQVTVNFIDESGDAQEVTQLYQYMSPPNHINSWVNNGEEFYQQHFNRAYRIMAEDIMMTLAY